MDLIIALIGASAAIIAAVITKRNEKKIRETHKQVTVNSHSSLNPTVLDLISDVRAEQVRVREELRDNTKVMERHLEWHLDTEEKE